MDPIKTITLQCIKQFMLVRDRFASLRNKRFRSDAPFIVQSSTLFLPLANEQTVLPSSDACLNYNECTFVGRTYPSCTPT